MVGDSDGAASYVGVGLVDAKGQESCGTELSLGAAILSAMLLLATRGEKFARVPGECCDVSVWRHPAAVGAGMAIDTSAGEAAISC